MKNAEKGEHENHGELGEEDCVCLDSRGICCALSSRNLRESRVYRRVPSMWPA